MLLPPGLLTVNNDLVELNPQYCESPAMQLGRKIATDETQIEHRFRKGFQRAAYGNETILSVFDLCLISGQKKQLIRLQFLY